MLNNNEKWKKTLIPNYLISNLGRIKSLPRDTRKKEGEIILKPLKHTGGYLRTIMWDKGVMYQNYIHILVLKTFRPTKKLKLQVRHLNGIKTDNRLINLKWGSPKENQKDRITHGTSQHGKSRKDNNRFSYSDVQRIKRLFVKYQNKTQVAKHLKLPRTSVSDVINGRTGNRVSRYKKD
jgi:hypothetical protein